MKKTFKILLAVISILIVGALMLYLFTNKFERKLNILDCEGTYNKKLFEKPGSGYLDFSESNAKVDVANCLCEKYIKNKETVYKKEIVKLYNNIGLKWKKYEKPNINADTICKYRGQIFIHAFDL